MEEDSEIGKMAMGKAINQDEFLIDAKEFFEVNRKEIIRCCKSYSS